jgi:hypothetical protein
MLSLTRRDGWKEQLKKKPHHIPTDHIIFFMTFERAGQQNDLTH